MYLKVDMAVLDTNRADNPHSVKEACCSMFRDWLSRQAGTGEQPRVWRSVLEAVKEVSGKTAAKDIERRILLD